MTDCYTAVKKKKLLLHIRQRILTDVMLIKLSQTHKSIYHLYKSVKTDKTDPH